MCIIKKQFLKHEHFLSSHILVCFTMQLSKRSHHNALERKRRDHIKESFNGLRDAVPSLQGEKVRIHFYSLQQYIHQVVENLILVAVLIY